MNAIPITTGELAEKLNCELRGRSDLKLTGIATIDEAGPSELTFLANPRYRRKLPSSRAGAIIISDEEQVPAAMTRIISESAYQIFRSALKLMYPPREPGVALGIHPLSAVDPTAEIGEDVRIGPFVEVGAGVRIGNRTTLHKGAFIGRYSVLGEDCTIGVGAVIQHDVQIGERVAIGDGAVIGYHGFAYAPDISGYHKIPEVGTVVLEDDVEIGANCCIDRATIGETRIGRGSKLDNLIQIAHGVKIGENTVIAAQTGISGSVQIGSWVMMGGQVGTVGHIEIGDRMIIGAQAGVTKSFDIKGMVSGYPARPQLDAMRIEASLNKLPELVKKVKALEKKLKNLSGEK